MLFLGKNKMNIFSIVCNKKRKKKLTHKTPPTKLTKSNNEMKKNVAMETIWYFQGFRERNSSKCITALDEFLKC
jgi:hypothetical protein